MGQIVNMSPLVVVLLGLVLAVSAGPISSGMKDGHKKTELICKDLLVNINEVDVKMTKMGCMKETGFEMQIAKTFMETVRPMRKKQMEPPKTPGEFKEMIESLDKPTWEEMMDNKKKLPKEVREKTDAFKTCLAAEMGMVDESGALNVDAITENINEVAEAEVRDSLISTAEKCASENVEDMYFCFVNACITTHARQGMTKMLEKMQE